MNEDFLSFDLAKKLKEKGYTLDTAHHYDDNGSIVVSLVEFDERCMYPCPEIHQVLKWLRDSNAIHIHICLYSKGWYCDVYTYEYYEEDREYGAKHIIQLDEFSTYEEAALAGIEYALDVVI